MAEFYPKVGEEGADPQKRGKSALGRTLDMLGQINLPQHLPGCVYLWGGEFCLAKTATLPLMYNNGLLFG
jgi:hypothetical protein